ncbi:MAG: hypothetical protein NVSMB19_19100 [Vulcanimicrobiaceae bacterium]
MPATAPPATPAPTATPAPPPQPAPAPTNTAPASGAYIAPAGTQPFPSGPFVQRVTNARIDGASDGMIAKAVLYNVLGQLQFSTDPNGNPNDGGTPIYVAHESDPHYTVHCMYFSHCPIEGHVVAIPRGAHPAANLGYTSFFDDGAHDQHMAIRNLDTGREDDLWLAPQPNGVGGTLNVGYGGSYALASGGYGQAGATAAGFSLSNGKVRAVDLLAGRIPYALALTTPCENGYVAPAVGSDAGPVAGCPPIGSHVWLDSTDSDIANSGASADMQVIFRAMHEFGGYIVDRCGSCTLGVAPEGGLSYTSFGFASPWEAIVSMHPSERMSNGVYHVPVGPGSIDLRAHLHIIS